MHIPKTAGTSLRDMLQSKLKENEIFPSTALLDKHNGYPSISKLSQYEREIQNSTLFAGHYPLRNVEGLFGTNRKIITFLREPVSRTISHLRHVKLHNPKFKNSSLEDIFATDALRTQFDNMQVRYFLSYNENKDISEKDLINAEQNIKNFFFIGLSEKFESHVNNLFRYLGYRNLRQLRSNVFEEKIAIKEQKFEPTEGLIRSVEEKNKWDMLLYTSIKKTDGYVQKYS